MILDEPTVEVLALGDLMLTPGCALQGRSTKASIADLRKILGCSEEALAFANLEVSLPGTQGVISKEPQLIGEETSLREYLRELGVTVVSVANNHAFDAFDSGYEAVRRVLEPLGITCLGAGRDRTEAAAPRVFTRDGVRLGWLAFCDPSTKPSHMAEDDHYGVNPLIAERAIADIRSLKAQTDHVFISLHWGVEYSHLPSPNQIEVARRFVDAGATAVIGHHAHVVQGVERYKQGVIAYNLGNTVAADVTVGGRTVVRQEPRIESSVALRIILTRVQAEFETIPLRITRGLILVQDQRAERYFNLAQRLLRRGKSEVQWRRRRFVEDVILRTRRKLHPSTLRSLRPRHVGRFCSNLVRSLWGRSPE